MNEKNNIKKAVALRYKREKDRAPVVLSSGKGFFAEKIIAMAEENDIPIYENENLAHALLKINPGEEIPSELFEAVALLLTYIMDLDTKISKENNRDI
ncbi:MAG: EscU/YscU/HrcU family type III secretion system export apparatus switch protein [Bacillota bacterium]|nr:EscU/YscU/HrcU family type III secretion system export apparatus switch protein [Bacillota bacterium]